MFIFSALVVFKFDRNGVLPSFAQAEKGVQGQVFPFRHFG